MLIKDFVAVLPSAEGIAITRRTPSGLLTPPPESRSHHAQEPAATLTAPFTISSSAVHPAADRLSTADDASSTCLAAALRHRVGQTGSWLLSTSQFAAWENDTNKPLLWLHGPSGSGKTVLSSVLVHHLNSRSATATSRRPCLFYFFDCTDAIEKNGLEGMLRSFGGQLMLQVPGLRSSHGADETQQPSREQLVQVTNDFLAGTEGRPVDVVVDGIDECVEQDAVLQWLHDQMSSNGMRVCVSSKHAEPPSRFGRDQTSRIALDAAATEEDMKAVAHWTLAHDARFRRWQQQNRGVSGSDAFPFQQQRDLSDEDFRKDVVNTLVKRASGTFRLVPLQLDELARSDTMRGFKRTLATLPADLADTYARLLSAIPSPRRRAAIRLLRFALFSAALLTCAEATDALAVSLDMEPAFDPQDRGMRDVSEEIGELCAGLLEVRGEEGEEGEEEKGSGRVHVAHGSVREYLLSDPPRVDGYSDAFAERAAKAEMARVCMAYLAAVAGLWWGSNTAVPREVVERAFPFAGYAARYWAAFSQAVEEDVVGDVLAFVADEKARALMAAMSTTTTPADSRVPSSPFLTPLSFATQAALPLAVAELLETQQPPAEDRTAALLHACASPSSANHPTTTATIAAALLAAGADPNASSSGLPLALAARTSPALVHLLLDAGADPAPLAQTIPLTNDNPPPPILATLLAHPSSATVDWTPALATVYEDGLPDAARLFRAHGVQPPPRLRGHLLRLAARAGRAELVTLLLLDGKDDGKDDDDDAARPVAAKAAAAALDEAFWKVAQTHRAERPSAGHVAVLAALMERSTDDDDGGELAARFWRGMEGQVALMGLPCLEAILSAIPGAEGRGGGGGGGLLTRVCGGDGGFDHVAKARMLLAHPGGVVDSESKAEALRAACRAGDVQVVRLLLEHGADPRAEGPAPEEAAWEGRADAFAVAERNGRWDVVDVLLLSRDGGADWEAERARRVGLNKSHSRLRNEWRRGALGLGGVEAEA